MNIQFIRKKTGEILRDTDDFYFIMNDKVYRDNSQTFESQSSVIGFDDCIEEAPDIVWRVLYA